MASRVLGLALAVSVLVHLALFAWALSRPRPVTAPKNKPVELTVVEVVRPPPPAPPVAAVPEPTPPPLARPPVRKVPPPKSPGASTPTPSVPPEALADAPLADVPRAPSPPPSPDALTPRLIPRADLTLVPDGAPSDFGVTEEQAQGLRAPDVPDDLVGHIAREAVGKARVKRGLVHPYYAELGKAMLKHWDADRAVSAKGLRGFSEQFRDNSRLGMRVWQENAERFAASGSPLAEGEGDAPRMPERAPAAVDESLSRRQAMKRQNRQEWRSTRRAELRVVQAPDGRILEAKLVKPSRDPHVDKEAVKDVRAAAEAMPPPPPEVIAGKTELVSHWLFELVVSINPPVPTFSFEFDEALGYIDPRMPLDRRIYKRVRLLAVD